MSVLYEAYSTGQGSSREAHASESSLEGRGVLVGASSPPLCTQQRRCQVSCCGLEGCLSTVGLLHRRQCNPEPSKALIRPAARQYQLCIHGTMPYTQPWSV